MADAAASSEAPAQAAASKKRQREPETAPLPDELTLPQSAIMRIVKSKLPEGMLVGSDTKKAFGKACSLFILYVSTMCAAPRTLVRCQPWFYAACTYEPHVACTEIRLPTVHSLLARCVSCVRASLRACVRSAADVAKENNRSTMSANDFLAALRDLEFDDFLSPVEAALGVFREEEKKRSIEAAAKRAAKQIREGGQEAGDKAADDKQEEDGEAE